MDYFWSNLTIVLLSIYEQWGLCGGCAEGRVGHGNRGAYFRPKVMLREDLEWSMPRKVKATGHISEQFLDRFTAACRDFIPHNPGLARLVVAALLLRVKKRNPAEFQFLEYSLHLLAFLERPFPGLGESAVGNHPELVKLTQEVLTITLRCLVHGKPGRHEHHLAFLHLQRALLVQYFERNPYPQQFRPREAWVHAHAGPIWDLLSQIKCLCKYSKSLRDISLDDSHWNGAQWRVICLFLAKLHRTTPAQIQKLLSHSPRESR